MNQVRTRQGSTRTPLRTATVSRPAAESSVAEHRFDISEEGLGRRANPDRLEIVRALMFAQGLDERGHRLELASDSMTDEECRPHHIVAHRQGRLTRTAHQAAIYASADRFEDGGVGVSGLRRQLDGVPSRPGNRDAGRRPAGPPRPDRQSSRPAATTKPASLGSHLRLAETEAPAVPVRSGAASQQRDVSRPAISAHRRTVTRAGTQPLTAAAPVASNQTISAGALALAPRAERSASRQHRETVRPDLRVVAARSRPWGLYAVMLFWTAFAFAFLFAAVGMHAGLAQNQVGLDEVNVELEREEALNSQLRVDVAELGSPTRIAGAAARLGLATPDQLEFLVATPAPQAGVAATPQP
jgi:cell division protein FtsL